MEHDFHLRKFPIHFSGSCLGACLQEFVMTSAMQTKIFDELHITNQFVRQRRYRSPIQYFYWLIMHPKAARFRWCKRCPEWSSCDSETVAYP